MIAGNPNDFLDAIYSGQDVVYFYHGIKYWFQGYTDTDGSWHMEIFQYQPPFNKDGSFFTWKCNVKDADEGLKLFLHASIFDGKTFWKEEKDIQWVDD